MSVQFYAERHRKGNWGAPVEVEDPCFEVSIAENRGEVHLFVQSEIDRQVYSVALSPEQIRGMIDGLEGALSRIGESRAVPTF